MPSKEIEYHQNERRPTWLSCATELLQPSPATQYLPLRFRATSNGDLVVPGVRE